MSEEIRKRPVTRRRAAVPAADGPAEGGAAPVDTMGSSSCGHSGCGPRTCNVRYVGAVSHIRDHHALHASRGVGHIWAASIVTGFAIVITGVIAFQSAQARTPAQSADSQLAAVMQRLDRLERMVRETRAACVGDELRGGDGMGAEADDASDVMRKKQDLLGRQPSWNASSSAPEVPSSSRPSPEYPSKKPVPPRPNTDPNGVKSGYEGGY